MEIDHSYKCKIHLQERQFFSDSLPPWGYRYEFQAWLWFLRTFCDLPTPLSRQWLKTDLSPRCWFPYVGLRCQDLLPNLLWIPRSSRYSREPPCWQPQLKVVRHLFLQPIRGGQRPRAHFLLQFRALKTCSLFMCKMVSFSWLYWVRFILNIILNEGQKMSCDIAKLKPLLHLNVVTLMPYISLHIWCWTTKTSWNLPCFLICRSSSISFESWYFFFFFLRLLCLSASYLHVCFVFSQLMWTTYLWELRWLESATTCTWSSHRAPFLCL